MATIKVPAFGGMVPALDDRLIPDTAATLAENAWLYAGALRGLPTPKLIHTLVTGTAQKIFRVPADLSDSGNMFNNVFLEFEDGDTDIIRSPVFGDTHARYYFGSTALSPRYNTTARIEFTDDAPSSVITAAVTDLITWVGHTLVAGNPLRFTTTGTLPAGLSLATTYYVSSSGLTTDVFKVATTYAAAIEGAVVVDITDTGTGTHTATGQAEDPFLLGIPAPGAPVVVPSGGVGVEETRSYVVTWVSAFGEEGPPSDPHTLDGAVDDTWAITLPTPAAGDLGIDRNLRHVRIYRTIVSASGVATFFLVTELDIWDTSHNDTASDDTISENSQLGSTSWSAPPSDLKGFTLMGNGILAAFKNNEVWFSEAYRPHAFPPAYVLTLGNLIVGMGVANQALIVCTKGNPVAINGVNPAYMTDAKFAALEPCISRGSIVSAPEGVYYASANGLMLVRSGSLENITREFITRDKWAQFTGSSAIRAARFGTAYYAFGTILAGSFQADAFQSDAWTQEDAANAFAGMMIDPFNARSSFSLLASDDPIYGVIPDPWTGEVVIIRDSKVYWLDQTDRTVADESFVWISKIFQSNVTENFSALKVYFEVPDVVPDDFGTIKIYANGVLKLTKTLETSGKLIRLPSGFKADFWQFRLDTPLKILSVHMATTVEELRGI